MKKDLGDWFRNATLILLCTVIMNPYPALAEATKRTADEKVALVNGTVITKVEFEREMTAALRQMMSTGRQINQSQLPEFSKGVLESLIGQELIFQESRKKGIKIEDNVLNEQIEKIKKGFPDEEAFQSALEKSQTSEDILRSDLRKKLSVQNYIDQEFSKSTSIPEEDVKSFYNSHPEAFKKPEQIRARHILIKVDPNADADEKKKAKEQIVKIQDRLKKGEDFAELAKEVSGCPSAEKGGDLGFFGRGQMVPPFEKVAFALPQNEVSDIVETQFGYHLIKVVDKKTESVSKYDEVKDRLQAYMTQLKVREKVKAHVDKLIEKAKIERYLEESTLKQ